MDIKLDIIYNLETDLEAVSDTLNDLEWLQKNDYKFFLPKSLDLKTYSNVKGSIKNEYHEEDYKEIGGLVDEEWKNKWEILLKKIFDEIKEKPQEEYNIFLTRYGVGGSYYRPNNIVVNIQSVGKKNISETIVHEIIHLAIETYVKENNIKHWQKERIVDSILKRHISNYKMQLINNTETVDQIISQYYPDIVNITKQLNKVNNPLG